MSVESLLHVRIQHERVSLYLYFASLVPLFCCVNPLIHACMHALSVLLIMYQLYPLYNIYGISLSLSLSHVVFIVTTTSSP